MKKFFLSFFVVAGSAGYALSTYLGGPSASANGPVLSTTQTPTQSTEPAVVVGQANGGSSELANTVPATQTDTPAPTNAPAKTAVATPVSTPTPTPTQAQAPAPAPKPRGQYVDGTYTGSTADAYYGYVQVQATVQGGKLTDVTFLQYPSDRRTSQYINSRAMPILKQEAIQAQSANVSGVSGASDTSAAFVQSLGNALSQAKA